MSFGDLAVMFIDAALVAYAGAVVAYLAEVMVLGSRRPQAVSATTVSATSVSARSRVAVAVAHPAGATAGVPPAGLADAGAAGVDSADRSEPARDPASAWTARAERWGRLGLGLLIAAFVLNLGSVVARGIAVERVPWGNMYEFTTMAALAAVGVFLVIARRRDIHYLGVWVGGVALVAVGLAVMVFYTEPGPLLPALRSTWLVIHVLAAITATGLFTVGAAAAALHLLAARSARRTVAGAVPSRLDTYLGRLPGADDLERISFRVTAIAFPIWTFAVIAGSIWAQYAWARYWGWDPKETWAFITWVVYAGYLHARLTAGWRGKKASWIALLAYATLLFNFVGVNMFFSGLHSYAGI